jgi:uncharacterized cupredoxin-like copper-binding protein/Cu/Ag efflux protein CusF
MKTLLITASAALFAVGSYAHGDDHHAASAPAAEGHGHNEHGHDESDAIGAPGQAAEVTRTVKVDMTDAMRFNPANVRARQGETIRFVLKNSGQVKHEFVLGTEKELKAHYELMKKFPEMEHADPNMVTLAPGQTGEVIWQFTKAGKVDFACLQSGHYDAGMKGAVMVAGAASASLASAQSPAAPASVAAAQMSPPTAADMSEGEVRKVDKNSKRITLRHGPIKNLDMPGMTMVFHVKDPAMLEKVKAGDKVQFIAEKINGALTVTAIEAVR